MTYAEAAVKAGYEADDENHVPTASFFGMLKGLAAMKFMKPDDKADAERRIAMLQSNLDELKAEWGL